MVVRLLPAAVTVLLGTVLAAAVLLPEGRWNQTVREVVAAALFLENWQLAADSVDYAARNNATSVVQHFWSLSIQVQFFLIWPVLVAVVAMVARGAVHRLHTHLSIALLGVFAMSLTYSVALTITNQPLAYFHTLTRLWEFALGGLLALWMGRFPWTREERVAFGWVGVVGLLVCGAVLPVGAVFPGIAALWPTACGGLVLLAGVTRSRYGVDRLLTLRPGAVRRRPELLPLPLALAGARPVHGGAGAGRRRVLRRHRRDRGLRDARDPHPPVRRAAGAPPPHRASATPTGSARSGVAAVLVAAGCWQLVTVQRAHTAPIGDAAHPGALALVDGPPAEAPLLPAPVSVYDDWVRVDAVGLRADGPVPVRHVRPARGRAREAHRGRRRLAHAAALRGAHPHRAAAQLADHRHPARRLPVLDGLRGSRGRAGLPCLEHRGGRRDRRAAPRRRRHTRQPGRPAGPHRADPAGFRRAVVAAARPGDPRAGGPRQPALRLLGARLRAAERARRRDLRRGPGRRLRRRPARTSNATTCRPT